ncbi:MAG: ABC transporter permease [Lachnospiraceae bacterium]|nr:ABC transporter permease [Lachnospiraceae bacterium]
MKKYRVIYRSVLMENLQYAANIAMGFISFSIIVFVFIQLWNYMYSSPQELIAGYTKSQMIWYVLITETIWFGTPSHVVTRQVAADIRGGNIAYLINKPYHYTLYCLAKYTGGWSVQLPMFALTALGLGAVLVGPLPAFHPWTLLAVTPVIIAGITIDAVLRLCISMISFWIEDSNPFQWLYNKLLLVVGTIFPVEIFPEVLQPFFKFTPIYTVCYGPAKLIVDFSTEKYAEILLAQALYLAAACGLMFFLYGKGVKKLYVNGG